MIFPAARLTAVALTAIDDQTVAFLGTSNGHIKKVSKNSSVTVTIMNNRHARLIDLLFGCLLHTETSNKTSIMVNAERKQCRPADDVH